MAAPKGTRPPGGSRKGIPNKATADVKALAGVYSERAIKELFRLATNAESEAARVAAIKELLDRAHGKAKQSVELEGQIEAVIKSIRLVGPEG